MTRFVEVADQVWSDEGYYAVESGERCVGPVWVETFDGLVALIERAHEDWGGDPDVTYMGFQLGRW